MKKEFLTLKEAAKMLGVVERTMYRFIHERQLRATKIRYWRIARKDLEDFIQKRTNIKK
jgi:excisionase family DNA binding protein